MREVVAGAMIYIPSFIQISSDIHNLIGEDSQTHRHIDSMEIAKPTFIFSKEGN
jgi:hypothetical protein